MAASAPINISAMDLVDLNVLKVRFARSKTEYEWMQSASKEKVLLFLDSKTVTKEEIQEAIEENLKEHKIQEAMEEFLKEHEATMKVDEVHEVQMVFDHESKNLAFPTSNVNLVTNLVLDEGVVQPQQADPLARVVSDLQLQDEGQPAFAPQGDHFDKLVGCKRRLLNTITVQLIAADEPQGDHLDNAMKKKGRKRKRSSSSITKVKKVSKSAQFQPGHFVVPTPQPKLGYIRVYEKMPKFTEASMKSTKKNVLHMPEAFECQICWHVFSSKNNAEKHVQSCHLEMRPYSCEFCEHSHAEAENARRHMLQIHKISRSNHEINPWMETKDKKAKCARCEQKFITQDLLNQHLVQIHNDDSSVVTRNDPAKLPEALRKQNQAEAAGEQKQPQTKQKQPQTKQQTKQEGKQKQPRKKRQKLQPEEQRQQQLQQQQQQQQERLQQQQQLVLEQPEVLWQQWQQQNLKSGYAYSFWNEVALDIRGVSFQHDDVVRHHDDLYQQQEEVVDQEVYNSSDPPMAFAHPQPAPSMEESLTGHLIHNQEGVNELVWPEENSIYSVEENSIYSVEEKCFFVLE